MPFLRLFRRAKSYASFGSICTKNSACFHVNSLLPVSHAPSRSSAHREVLPARAARRERFCLSRLSVLSRFEERPRTEPRQSRELEGPWTADARKGTVEPPADCGSVLSSGRPAVTAGDARLSSQEPRDARRAVYPPRRGPEPARGSPMPPSGGRCTPRPGSVRRHAPGKSRAHGPSRPALGAPHCLVGEKAEG